MKGAVQGTVGAVDSQGNFLEEVISTLRLERWAWDSEVKRGVMCLEE